MKPIGPMTKDERDRRERCSIICDSCAASQGALYSGRNCRRFSALCPLMPSSMSKGINAFDRLQRNRRHRRHLVAALAQ
jgi:hypothetical protein